MMSRLSDVCNQENRRRYGPVPTSPKRGGPLPTPTRER